MASHVAVLNAGKVEQFGPPRELLEHPRTTFVATFLGTPPANLLPVAVTDGQFTFQGQPVATAPADFARPKAQLLYRAQAITPGAIPGRPQIAATFSEAAPIAGQSMVTALVGALRLTAMAEGFFAAEPGAPITLSLLGTPEAIFDTDGRRMTA